ncbi:hypothetical protein F0L17_13220 [Streptomyces sp. TRM43335]|uniref:Lipoprotein n=1 Tax=Streptomyces taklimakanensis TaxID=2569853 RepID=A0A6G2BCQ4_9ACTN|nr:hypothetical protein [Streptomyces taklimakanensis]MTE20061.1 hypothetical protein [Streptomyces taklimakanensis]
MARVSRRTRTGAVLAAGLLAGTALAGCGSEEDGTGEKAAGTGAEERNDAAEVVRTAHEKTVAAETAAMTMKVDATVGGRQQTATGNGTIDLSDGTSDMTIEMGGERVEQRIVDQTLYQKLPAALREKLSADKPWIKVDLREVAARNGTVGGVRLENPARAVDYTKALSDDDAKRLGTEKIDGVNTTHYRVTVDVEELAGEDDARGERLRQQLGESLPMDLWLDEQNRIRRQQFEISLDNASTGSQSSRSPQDSGKAQEQPQDATVRTVMEFGDFGTEVDVSAPPADKTADVTDKLAGQSGRNDGARASSDG